MKKTLGILLCSVFAASSAFSGLGDSVSALLKLPIPHSIELCGEPVPLDHEDVLERLDLELVVALGDPTSAALWFKRSQRYFPMIEKKLDEYGLPSDLKYVAVIESNLRANALSSARAVGPWQFIGSTGAEYGLSRSSWVEERKDWDKATDAALRLLKDLYGDFGSWPLAMAAYNAGKRRVSTSMQNQGEDNFYGLSLPRETERYVFRIIAAKLILERPEAYGINLDGARLYPPEKIVDLELKVDRRSFPVSAIAEAAGISYRCLRRLNEWIVDGSLPRGTYVLKIPDSAEKKFAHSIALWEKANPEPKTEYYKVRKGDTLSAIARKHGVSLSDLYSWNSLTSRSIILPGQTIAIQIIN